MKDFLSGGQRLYLRNYDIKGRLEPCLVMKVYVGWAEQSKIWLFSQLQPVHLRHLRKLYRSSILSIRPPPKPPHFFGYMNSGFPILLALLSTDTGLKVKALPMVKVCLTSMKKDLFRIKIISCLKCGSWMIRPVPMFEMGVCLLLELSEILFQAYD
ncbi:hypothetical protein GQ457_01G045060 [Hibiscus cannabinus]